MAKRTPEQIQADTHNRLEGERFSQTNGNAVVHFYAFQMPEEKTGEDEMEEAYEDRAYVADALLPAGDSLKARVKAYHEKKDKHGFRIWEGEFLRVLNTIGKAKSAKSAKSAPVLIAAKKGGKK